MKSYFDAASKENKLIVSSSVLNKFEEENSPQVVSQNPPLQAFSYQESYLKLWQSVGYDELFVHPEGDEGFGREPCLLHCISQRSYCL